MSVQFSKAAPSVESIINQRLSIPSSIPSTNQKSSTSTTEKKVYFPHRLDKASSGTLAIALHRPTVATLNDSLANHEWVKRYRVLTYAPSSSIVSDIQQQVIQSRNNILKKRNLLNLCYPNTTKLIEKGIIYSLVVPLSSLSSIPTHESRSTNVLKTTFSHEKSANFSVSLFSPQIIPDVDPENINHQELLIKAEQLLSPNLRKLKLPYKLAITSFNLINTWNIQEMNILDNSLLCLYEAQPITGRTHQLRVHFSECGMPVLGDPYYTFGGLDNNQEINQLLKLKLGLHNKQLSTNTNNNNHHKYSILSSSSSLFSAFQPQGKEMGLQSYSLAFPYPIKRNNNRNPKNNQNNNIPNTESKHSSGSTISTINKYPIGKAIRGASYDKDGRLLVTLPIPQSWNTLFDNIQKYYTNKHHQPNLRVYNKTIYNEWNKIIE